MTTFLFTHSACVLHDNGPGHPESPARLKAILSELEKPDFSELVRCEAHEGSLDIITLVHPRDYIQHLLDLVPKHGYVALDQETSLSSKSGEAALRAAGALIGSVDAVISHPESNAFCAVRPPGHHAGGHSESGFCLFNNIAIGAAYARQTYGLKRIAIIDFDVHHGNGTQVWAEQQKEILFISSHQFPLWPGSGREEEQGPLGNIINIPLPRGTKGAFFREIMRARALSAIEAFKPEMVFVSAGFDAHKADPLGGLCLDEDDYGWITAQLVDQSKRLCGGRLISTLEGGYDIEALAASVGAHVHALMGHEY